MTQRSKFAEAAKACKGISSRKARNSCVAQQFGGHGHARKRGRGSKQRRRAAFGGMSRKQYVEVAKILRSAPACATQLADRFAEMFKADNSSFDVQRFRQATFGRFRR